MNMSRLSRFLGGAALLLSLAQGSSCIVQGHQVTGAQTFVVTVTKVNGGDPPTAEAPIEANLGDRNEVWDVDIQATAADGDPKGFHGYVRLSVQPGAVSSVENLDTGEVQGRNIYLTGGHALARVTVTAVYGPTRLWVEDLGYNPAPPGEIPACANGKNDDPEEDVLVDYPNDPGCEFADDDTETGGTYTAGSSPPIQYSFPTLREIQGVGAKTPYPYEGIIQVKTADPSFLVVTRISKDGFYVTDLNDQDKGFNHLFAFNFSTPSGMQVCDRVTYLSGTLNEFFGFTELNFPSYRLDPLLVGHEDDCPVPEPKVLDPATIADDSEMEKYESGLVRVEGYTVPSHFGPGLVVNNKPDVGASNCDLNGDGRVDFTSDAEGGCNTACENEPECSEWTAYVARGNYKVSTTGSRILINTDGAAEFSPTANPGAVLTGLTGTLRNFSGGTLNWTIEVRCTDDVVCDSPGCATEQKDSKHACVSLFRTEDDNDEGTN